MTGGTPDANYSNQSDATRHDGETIFYDRRFPACALVRPIEQDPSRISIASDLVLGLLRTSIDRNQYSEEILSLTLKIVSRISNMVCSPRSSWKIFPAILMAPTANIVVVRRPID